MEAQRWAGLCNTENPHFIREGISWKLPSRSAVSGNSSCSEHGETRDTRMYCKYNSMSYNTGVGISKDRKCYDLVNASYLWLVDRATVHL